MTSAMWAGLATGVWLVQLTLVTATLEGVVQVRTTCGGTYTHIVENYGQLQSPWYSATPSNYSNGLDCDYVIGPAHNIVLFFETFDVPSVPAGNCGSDSLTISAMSKYFTESRQLGSALCGDVTKATVNRAFYTDGPYMRLHFKTEHSGAGWRAHFVTNASFFLLGNRPIAGYEIDGPDMTVGALSHVKNVCVKKSSFLHRYTCINNCARVCETRRFRWDPYPLFVKKECMFKCPDTLRGHDGRRRLRNSRLHGVTSRRRKPQRTGAEAGARARTGAREGALLRPRGSLRSLGQLQSRRKSIRRRYGSRFSMKRRNPRR